MNNLSLASYFFISACGGGAMTATEMKYTEQTDSEEDKTENEENTFETLEEESEICKNDYHPIHLDGWSKDFIAYQEGVAGIAREEGLGMIMENGIEVYQYRDLLETYHESWFGTDTHGWDTVVSAACNHSDQSGMFILGWKGSYKSDDTWGQEQEISAIHSVPRKYLSSEFALGYEGEWSYDYDIEMEVTISGGSYPATQHISGVYQDIGFQEITLFDGTTTEAYKLVNTFDIVDAQGTQRNGYIEQYWVKGLGLVREVYINRLDSTEVLSKELSGYTGLSILE